MSQRYSRLIIFLILSFLVTLVACQVVEQTVHEPTAVPPTSTAMPTSTAVPTLVPTITAVPPTPTATNRPPAPTAVSIATSTAVATESAEDVFQDRLSISPDGRWQAQTLLTFVEEGGFVQGYQTDLTVTALDGTASWVAYSTLQGAGLGYDVPTVVLWSNDNQSLFFTLSATPDGCGYLLSTYHSGLYKLDLANGKVEKLEVGGALSPDGKMVASMVWEPEIGVEIYNLADQTATTFAWDTVLERGNTALNLVWAPDSQAIALEFAPGSCEETDYSLIVLDLLTDEKATLVWHEPQLFSIVEWATVSEIYLRDQANPQQTWLLDVNSGELTRVD
ncbi:MAG: hypothetical protein KC434_14300 [Anaerolineales bacterium]|nr:hypothetical protein [Anaerolineales bacterium]